MDECVPKKPSSTSFVVFSLGRSGQYASSPSSSNVNSKVGGLGACRMARSQQDEEEEPW